MFTDKSIKDLSRVSHCASSYSIDFMGGSGMCFSCPYSVVSQEVEDDVIKFTLLFAPIIIIMKIINVNAKYANPIFFLNDLYSGEIVLKIKIDLIKFKILVSI